MLPSCLYLSTTSAAQPISKPAGSPRLPALAAVLLESTTRDNCSMLKATACLLFTGAASTAALPLSLGLAAAGAAALLLDNRH